MMNLSARLYRIVRNYPTVGRVLLRTLPDWNWRVTVPGIGPMRIGLRRNRSFWLHHPLTHEGFMLGALRRLIAPGDVVFDVGANIGMDARFMVSRFGAGKVVAFEPMSENVAYLQHNLALGNIADKVQHMEVALDDFDGSDLFQVDDMSSASGTLDVVAGGRAAEGRRQYGFPPKTEQVQVARLDTLVASGAVPIPHVIKLDVEGAEARVLAGAVETIKRHGPRLVIEMHGAGVAREVVGFLLGLHYQVYGYLSGDQGPVKYRRLSASDIPLITRPYSLHHCVAAPAGENLATPIEPYRSQ